MMMNKDGMSKHDIEYYLFFAVIATAEGLNKGSSNKIVFLFSILSIVFLGYKIIASDYTLHELLFIAFLGCFSILLYLQTGKIGGVLSLAALMGLKGVDKNKLIHICFYLRLFAFLILVLLTMFGVITNNKITHIRGDNSVIRSSMGFSHPNQFHIAFVILLLLYLYLYFNKIKGSHLLILAVINLLIYYRSYSRTSTLIGFMAILLMIWFRSNILTRLRKLFCYGILPFCFSISILPPILYEYIPGIRSVDRLLQWRITFGKHYLFNYPITLFGNNLNQDPIVLDNSYIEFIINYGLVFTLFYIGLHILLIHRFLKFGSKKELLLIACFSVYGITEAFLPNLFSNISMIFIGDLFFRPPAAEEYSTQNIPFTELR